MTESSALVHFFYYDYCFFCLDFSFYTSRRQCGFDHPRPNTHNYCRIYGQDHGTTMKNEVERGGRKITGTGTRKQVRPKNMEACGCVCVTESTVERSSTVGHAATLLEPHSTLVFDQFLSV